MENIIHNKEEHKSFLVWFQEELVQLLKSFPTVQFSINFAPKQLFYPETHIFFANIQSYAKQLIIEITEDAPLFAASIEPIDSLTFDKKFHSIFASIKAKGYCCFWQVGNVRNGS